MLQLQFLLVNAHFTVNLLTALVCFAVSWLYFDAWLGRKDYREGTKMLGFLLLSLSFIVHATHIDQSILESPILADSLIKSLTALFRISGYIVLIIGQVVDPLQPLPEYRAKSRQKGFGIKNPKVTAFLILGAVPMIDTFSFLFPVLAIITSYLYMRRATLGLEFHLRTIGFSLMLLAVSELAGLASLFENTSNISLSKLVSSFGPLWIIEHTLLVFYFLILGRWVWSYLTKRLETQLFIVFTTLTLTIFLITAIFFTSVSLSNLRDGILKNLDINVKVLQYTINSKKAETLSDAQAISQNPEIIKAITGSDRKSLADITTATLLSKQQDILIIINQDGAILMRADDPEKLGGSMSDDPLVKRALLNERVSGVVSKEGVMAPVVSVRAASPIISDGKTIGAVLIGTTIDNAFVDGLKQATGLDASVYGDNIRSATTFVSPDGKSRWVGIKEETDAVKEDVLIDGKLYSGNVNILNISYLSAFLPIKDINDIPVGMLFVGRPEVSTIQAAGKLIEQTFLVTVILLVLSIFPAFFVSKYIIGQIK
jgi:hypothetical protein